MSAWDELMKVNKVSKTECEVCGKTTDCVEVKGPGYVMDICRTCLEE